MEKCEYCKVENQSWLTHSLHADCFNSNYDGMGGKLSINERECGCDCAFTIDEIREYDETHPSISFSSYLVKSVANVSLLKCVNANVHSATDDKIDGHNSGQFSVMEYTTTPDPKVTNKNVKTCYTKGKRCNHVHDMLGCYCANCGFVYNKNGDVEINTPTTSFLMNMKYNVHGKLRSQKNIGDLNQLLRYLGASTTTFFSSNFVNASEPVATKCEIGLSQKVASNITRFLQNKIGGRLATIFSKCITTILHQKEYASASLNTVMVSLRPMFMMHLNISAKNAMVSLDNIASNIFSDESSATISLMPKVINMDKRLEQLENLILDDRPNTIKCTLCGELLMNIPHGMYHRLLQHPKEAAKQDASSSLFSKHIFNFTGVMAVAVIAYGSYLVNQFGEAFGI
ncbi:MAG: hypothetical protein GTO44_10065 [Hydrotalea flava]|nr:hypothetical protein [Hydrotalea flava]NIN15398.1 hypothetical protein [Hydrotalea flava]